MEKLLESYINGNIAYVCNTLSNEGGFSELYSLYVELYNPSAEGLQLFVNRLGS